MASGGLPFPGTGCPIPDVGYNYFDMINMWDIVSALNHLPRMFLSTDYLFEKMDWTSYFGPPLYGIYILYWG